ncbi:MAG: polyphosphate polymerase domain-containing protein [Leadbetterella sp.]
MALFENISLQEMDGVKLMDRVDSKYLIPLNVLPQILEEIIPFYRILEINGVRLNRYETQYFDFNNYELYHNHQAGKTNRYKVRFRKYVESDLCFFEIKHKNNKGRTKKIRLKQPEKMIDILNPQEMEFLESQTPLDGNMLKGNLWVYYNRLTLVNRFSTERLTIDLDLSFKNKERAIEYPKVVVAEVKQEKLGASPIINVLRSKHLMEGSISKYCLGIMSLNPLIKYNRFKLKYLHLNKIIKIYDSTASGIFV